MVCLKAHIGYWVQRCLHSPILSQLNVGFVLSCSLPGPSMGVHKVVTRSVGVVCMHSGVRCVLSALGERIWWGIR